MDWRSGLCSDARNKVVERIMDTLQKHMPHNLPMNELLKIACRFEERQDYVRRISVKILSLEHKSSQNNSNAPPPNPSDASQIVSGTSSLMGPQQPGLQQQPQQIQQEHIQQQQPQQQQLQQQQQQQLQMRQAQAQVPQSFGNNIQLSGREGAHGRADREAGLLLLGEQALLELAEKLEDSASKGAGEERRTNLVSKALRDGSAEVAVTCKWPSSKDEVTNVKFLKDSEILPLDLTGVNPDRQGYFRLNEWNWTAGSGSHGEKAIHVVYYSTHKNLEEPA
ncbi:hypothetical protein SELMODRAFT_420690 [Selaginella moellendorffii]|uniref:Mediator complex subunit 15 KIX domain-containing protein n=1 Tax=Selaginella moellendorffii TaxID=88036 RepID=D8SCT5_SELML|nr:hypothetical protein SELMODRAFT_420690 [Selaginella moellendorffii]